ncbi:MAG: BCCT family transporter [Burkholderiaceae bacterium]
MLSRFSMAVVAAFAAWGVIAPESLGAMSQAALAATTKYAGWWYLWVVAAAVAFALFLAFSRYGSLVLGDEDEEPAYSRGAWFSMLFAAGMGIGLVFWGAAEPISHFASPPPGVAPLTPDAANAAMRYSFFHWGLHPWALYSVVALAIAFFQFRRGAPATIGATVAELPYAPAWTATAVDILAVIATAFGVATSLGLGALQINAGLAAVVGMPVGAGWQVGIVVVTTMLFIGSALSGLDRGVKWLSSANLVLAAAIALFVFVVGPTVAILDTFTNTLGSYLTEFVRMSLRLTPFRDNSWIGDWTVFYWAWWISWSPFVGLFIARVSRGRTIREFVFGTLFAPALAAFIWFSVFGGTALTLQIFAGAPLVTEVKADIATALFALFQLLPFSGVLTLLTTVLIIVFFVTSGDSATFVLSMLSERGNPHPSQRSKLTWGLLVSAIAIALLLAGGLKALQSAAIVFALPFAVVIILMAISLYRALRVELAVKDRAERELRRRIKRQMAQTQD